VNGDLSSIDSGIPNSLPDGEMIKTPPPNNALTPRNANRNSKTFRVLVVFMVYDLGDQLLSLWFIS
jgi:hypothetical protein